MVGINIKENLLELEESINKTAQQAGRKREDILLLPATKTQSVDAINELIELGYLDYGENRVQEYQKKAPLIDKKGRFHMIGHLQSNKAKDIVGKTFLLHSLDRMSLAKEVNRRSKRLGVTTDALIQVNIFKEESKSGVYKEDFFYFLEDVLEYPNIRIKGLMTMAPETDNIKVIRETFRSLYSLKIDVESRNYKVLDMDYLSMGMSGDYKIAIEEGANIIRIGRQIFGERDYRR